MKEVLFNLIKQSTLSIDKLKLLTNLEEQELESIIQELIDEKRIFLNNVEKIKKQYTNPNFIFNDNKYLFYGLKQEYFYVLYLDTKKNLIERKLLFMGTIDRSLIHPREVFKNAYLCSASSFICMHNHPTGSLIPSQADIEITKTLKEIGRIQGIELVDHLIVSDNNYFSFFENHLME